MTIKQRHRHPIFAAALILLFLLTSGPAQARVGELDPGFGKDGRAFAPLKASYNPMASAPDGSILILNEGAVSRLRPDGQLDSSFGVGGRVTLGDIDGLRFRTTDIAVDSQGRVLVFGTTSDPSRSVDPQLMYNPPVEASWATVVRLNSSGQMDSSFGEGRGFVRSDLGLPPTFAPNLPTLRITTGDVDSQDRPVFIAGEAKQYSPCYGKLGIEWPARAIARLTVAGALDTAFDSDGVSLPNDLVGGNPTLDLDAADGLIVAGAKVSCQSGTGSGTAVQRLGADGAPNTGFGEGGVRVYRDTWRFSAVGPSGALILRKGRPTEGVLRVGPDGEPDQSFGRKGWTTVVPPAGAKRTFRPVAIDAQGRVLLAGSLVLPKPGRETKPGRTRSFFVVARLLPSGKPDLGFGKRGSIMTPLGWPSGVVAEEAFLDPQGRLVIAGAARKQERLVGLVLRRYLLGPA